MVKVEDGQANGRCPWKFTCNYQESQGKDNSPNCSKCGEAWPQLRQDGGKDLRYKCSNCDRVCLEQQCKNKPKYNQNTESKGI